VEKRPSKGFLELPVGKNYHQRSVVRNRRHNILVFGKTFEEHQSRLNLVLTALGEANLILNMKKRIFAADEVNHLGHIVKADGIRPHPEKVH